VANRVMSPPVSATMTWAVRCPTPGIVISDTDILAAVAAGKGTLEITSTLVRCPVINFSALR
jgi:hypothetical protein